MIYTTADGQNQIAEVDTEIIIGLRLNGFNWKECIKRHNIFMNRSVPECHIVIPGNLRSSQEWMVAIEEHWQKYYGYILQPHTKAAQRLGYHTDVQYPIIETFGIEIEFYSETDRSDIRSELERADMDARSGDYRDWNRESWVVKSDGSIEPPRERYIGTEIASPILTYNNIDTEITKVCEVLTSVDAKVNRSCGLHVHLGEHNFTGKRRSKIAYEFIRNENTIDKLMPESRRRSNNTYCTGWEDDRIEYYQRNLKDKTARQEIKGIVNPDGRYKKVNMQTPYTTIESRQHSGTTNQIKIIHWKDFLVGLSEHTAKNPFSELTEPDTMDTLIEKISTELPEEKRNNFQTFYKNRAEFLEGRQGENNEYNNDSEELPY